jgi:D-galacturonate reductase
VRKPEIVMVGGGMIAHDQILPSLYELQRRGMIGEITVCAQHARTVQSLAANEMIRRAFPGHSFRGLPDAAGESEAAQPELYKKAIAALAPRQIVIAAVPDPLHYEVIMTALRHDQHVMAVKPLVLTVAHAREIELEARRRNLLVGVEYHKRFDDRSLLARRRYRAGWFGEFKLGTACLMEKWYYRHSNFQNWFTCENTDAFTYIGCHYVDLVHFITGLLPVSVSVYGIKDRFPNGNEGYLWSDARVIWNNGACLNVQNSLSFPDDAPGTNTQGITLYGSNGQKGAWLEHSDQYRGLRYCYTEKPDSPGATTFAEPSTDYFQYVESATGGLQPVGYGYRSIEAIVQAMLRVEAAPESERAGLLAEIDRAGLIATPANSSYNEMVTEAARLSIANGGREVLIEAGELSGVRLRP